MFNSHRILPNGRITQALILFLVAITVALNGCDHEPDRGAGSDGPSRRVPSGSPASSTTTSAGPTGRSALSLPDFSLRTLGGERITSDGLEGKVVLINFWATWCPPCVEEVPDFQRFYQKWKDEGFVVLGIAEKRPSGNGDRSDVRAFADRHGVTYPLAMSNERIRNRFLYKFGYRQKLPTSFLIDRDGKLLRTFVGRVTPGQLKNAVRPLLNES